MPLAYLNSQKPTRASPTGVGPHCVLHYGGRRGARRMSNVYTVNPWERFLSPIDTIRVCRALEKLLLHGLHEFALTGSLATEIQLSLAEAAPRLRRMNDIDIVVRSFDSIPQTIANGFLFRHIHPKAAPGQTLMQLVDPEQTVRVD